MNGSISSAQARDYISDKTNQPAQDHGTMSSHDALKEPEIQSEPAEQVVVQREPEPVEEKPNDSPNFRALRQKAEAEREARERLEQENRAKDEIIQRILKAQSKGADISTDEADEYDFADKRQVNQLLKKVDLLENEIRQSRHMSAFERSKQNLKQKYSDYDDVMTEDNLKDLEYMEPTVAAALKTSGDVEGAAKIAYHMIKSLNIYQDFRKADPEDDKKRIAANMNKPKTPQSIGKSNSPLSDISPFNRELTQERKDMLWRKMQEKMRTKKSF